VGLAAVLTSVASYLVDVTHFAADPLGTVHKIAIYLGVVIGGITFTGSITAFGKLQGILASKPTKLPAHNQVNIGMALANLAGKHSLHITQQC
jgi:NAD/NADP transhydrogenase beta subunit